MSTEICTKTNGFVHIILYRISALFRELRAGIFSKVFVQQRNALSEEGSIFWKGQQEYASPMSRPARSLEGPMGESEEAFHEKSICNGPSAC